MKRAQLIADSVCVVCPECAASQPNRTTGSEMWMAEDFAKASGTQTCVSCDAQMIVGADSKVQFECASLARVAP